MKKVVVTGYGIICDLGKNAIEVAESLFNGDSGISNKAFEFKDGIYNACVGNVDLIEESNLFEKHNLRYDRCSHMALIASEECMKLSNINIKDEDPYRIGTVIGTSLGGMLSGEKFLGQWISNGYLSADRELLKQYPLHAITDLISMNLGFKGPKSVISTACSAGGNAIGMGFDFIQNDKCDIVLVGGVDPLSKFSFSGFNALKALDNSPCKPYSKSKGINLGEGAAFLLLESYEHAINRNVNIIAEVSGYGLTADAYHHTAPDLGGNGATRCMNMAITQSGLDKSNITYVNGHGTGTVANDGTESKAFKNMFREHLNNVYLSSTKGATAHCLGAAGAIEAVISVLAIQYNKIPPTIRFDDTQESQINYVPNITKELACNHVLSNSFAFGGNNCSIVFSKLNSDKNIVSNCKDDSIVITGIGCVGVGGLNISELWDTIDNNKKCIKRINTFDSEMIKCKWMGHMPDIDWQNYIHPKFLRRIDEITKLTMTSSRQALQDSEYKVTIKNCDRIGIIYATGTGPLDTIYSLSSDIETKGAKAVSPYQFPNSVLNAAPGNVSISNMLKGPTSTICTGGISFTLAIEYASYLLKSNKADALLVVSSDECNFPLIMGNDKMNLLSSNKAMPFCKNADGMILSSGSTAFLLETKEHAESRKASKIYATIKNCEFGSEPTALSDFSREKNALEFCIKRNLKKCNLKNIDYYLSSANGIPSIDYAEQNIISNLLAENTVVGAPAALIGTSVSTYAGYGLLFAIHAFKDNIIHTIPKNVSNTYESEYQVSTNKRIIKSACIASTSFGGACSSMIVEKYENS